MSDRSVTVGALFLLFAPFLFVFGEAMFGLPEYFQLEGWSGKYWPGMILRRTQPGSGGWMTSGSSPQSGVKVHAVVAAAKAGRTALCGTANMGSTRFLEQAAANLGYLLAVPVPRFAIGLWHLKYGAGDAGCGGPDAFDFGEREGLGRDLEVARDGGLE